MFLGYGETMAVRAESCVCSQFQEEIVEVTQFFLKRACRTNRCCSSASDSGTDSASREEHSTGAGSMCIAEQTLDASTTDHADIVEVTQLVLNVGAMRIVIWCHRSRRKSRRRSAGSLFPVFSCDGCFGFFSCAEFTQHMGLNAALAKARNVLAAASRSLCAKRLDKTTRMEVCEKRHVQCLAQHDAQNVPENM